MLLAFLRYGVDILIRSALLDNTFLRNKTFLLHLAKRRINRAKAGIVKVGKYRLKHMLDVVSQIRLWCIKIPKMTS